jgi:Rha family phage regulatory protein
MQIVKSDSDQLSTTSKIIADVFGKVHRVVLKSIAELDCSEDFRQHNFIKGYYTSSQNKKITCYFMTLDAAMMLCMSFTGRKATLKKESIISQFKDGVSFSTILKSIKDIDIDEPDMYIYIAQESVSGNYKVGISKHPEKRINQLNIGNPNNLKLIHQHLAIEGFKDEALAHKILAPHNIRSEWFKSDADLSFLIES